MREPECEGWTKPFCETKEHAEDLAGEAAGQLGGSVVDQVAQSFANASVEILKYLATFWIDPQQGDHGTMFGRLFSPRISSEADDPMYFLAQHTGWLVTWVAVLGLLLAAGRMAWQRRGEPFREAFSGLITLVIAVFTVSQVVNVALAAGDAYSRWIIENSTQGDVVGGLGKAGATMGGQMSGVVLIVALLAILSSVAQLAMLFVRGAMLVLIAGALPLAAAASVTPEGKNWFRKMIGWLVALVLYKPVAATIYAVAFKALMGDSISQLQGLVLVVLAIVALPALMRFIVPMVSAAGGGGGGGGAMAGAGGAVATGARMAPAMGGGGKAGGGSGPSTKSPSKDPTGSKVPGPKQTDGKGDQPLKYTQKGAQMGGPKGALIGGVADAGRAVPRLAGKAGRDATGDNDKNNDGGGPRGSQ